MALVLNDRVKETSTTTGQGTLDLAGAATGFETFVTGIGNSNTTYYGIVHATDGTWELGIGTVTDASPDTLARTTVIDTSAGNTTKIDFATGTKNVFCTLPSSKAVFLDADGDVTLGANLDIGGNLVVTGTTTFNGGTLTLGDANTDNIVFGGEVDSNIIPDDDNTYDLGSSSKEWKDIYIDGVAYLDEINFNGTAISSTAAELNVLDGITAVVGELNALDLGSTAVGTAIASKAVILDSNKDYTGIRNLTITGELDAATLDISGAIDVAGTTNLDVVDIDGAVDMATTLALGGNADFNGDLDVDGTTNLDNTDIDGTLVVDGSNISLDSTSTLNIDNSNTSNGITIGTATSGVPISIGHSTSEVTINDNLTVTGNFTVSGTSTTVDSTTVSVADSMFKLAKDQGTSADALDFGFYGQYGVGGTAKFAGIFRDVSATGDPFTFFDDLQAEPGTTVNTDGTGYALADVVLGGLSVAGTLGVTGVLTGTSLDISGDIDVDGTTNLDVVDIDGAVDMASTLTVGSGITVTNGTSDFSRTHSTTNASLQVLELTATSSGNMADGFGPSIHFSAADGGATSNQVAEINVVRAGSDTAFNIELQTADTTRMTIGNGLVTVVGELDASSLDISGDADIDGTLEADAITIGGVSTDTLYASPGFAVAMAIAL
jgi:cytoskeletal protein CcmA (bactofilin family)